MAVCTCKHCNQPAAVTHQQQTTLYVRIPLKLQHAAKFQRRKQPSCNAEYFCSAADEVRDTLAFSYKQSDFVVVSLNAEIKTIVRSKSGANAQIWCWEC